MQPGCSLPVADIGTGPSMLRDYAQAAEGLGYSHLVALDHVLGPNPATDHGGPSRRHHCKRLSRSVCAIRFSDRLHQRIGFAVGVLILAQRQEALVAKQGLSRRAVRRPVPAGDRRRLERVRVHRPQQELPRPRPALGRASAGDAGAGAEPHVDFTGEFCRIEDAGIIPRPRFGPRADLVEEVVSNGDFEATFMLKRPRR